MKRVSSDSTFSSDTDALHETIERAKQELEHMIDMNPQVMLLVDHSGMLMRTNKILLELLGISDFSQVLGKRLNDLFHCEDEMFFSRLLEDRSGLEVRETKTILPDGQSRVLRFTIVGSGPKRDLSVVIIYDATGEKRRAAHLKKKYKMEAVEALVGALMHNINQPLTVIMVRAGLMRVALEKGPIDSTELKKDLQDITKSATQISDMIKHIETPVDFVTERYYGATEILDIERSGKRTDEMESSCLAALDSLLIALDVHVAGAVPHARRTGEYAAYLSKLMGLDEKEADVIKRCAIFHDIGKIGIPDSIFQKSRCLTLDEMEIMEKHTKIGYDLLRNFPFMKEEAETAYCHHERPDGKGYPQGLSGKDIPISARIVLVADAFDAMRSDRVYQPALSLEAAVREITEGAGTQFDSEVVKVFKSCYKELDSLHDRRSSNAQP